MARPLASGSLSLTGGGSALVTDADGSIGASEVAGFIVGDVRVLSTWRITTSVPTRLAGYERTGPSADRLIWTIGTERSVDPVGTLTRSRSLTAGTLTEVITLTGYVEPIVCSLTLAAERDDQPVYDLGDPGSRLPTNIVDGEADGFTLPPPGSDGSPVSIVAPDWCLDGGNLSVDVRVDAGSSWTCTVVVSTAERPTSGAYEAASTTSIETTLGGLARTIATARDDLAALTMRVDGRSVLAAGSPFFLALFGRDSMISGMQALVDTPGRLTEILDVLAAHQATSTDETTRAQPGRILHELRVGHAGLFGVPPGTPYFGAVDTAALFVVALGEAMRWGASRDDVARLLPHARAALAWCRDVGDVDGDGFVESVPDPGGLTNLGWKDSGDSMVRPDGSTVVGPIALAEVQAYWYRALRTLADIERWLGVGDGSEALAEADRLRDDFDSAFVFDVRGEPFVGLGLDPDKRLLAVRASNAGHVLWSGILDAALGSAVARQLAASDLFSGWGVRTVSAAERGYNPFGYHRGSVWPHDTGFALHGAARYGVTATVQELAGGLVALGNALDGQLPELLSGIGRDAVSVPVRYAAACRPQAWSAGTSLVVVRSLIGLEPDLPGGLVRVHPSLPPDHEMTLRRVRIGDRELSLTVRGDDVVDADVAGLDVVTGDSAVLATTEWGPHR